MNSSAILQNPQRAPSITRSQLLSNISINHIAIDAINQKWVSTNEGIWVLNEDGTEVVQILTTSNSPLISSVISTIGIDKKNGIVYVGTSIGLQSFETPIVTPTDQFSLDCYPSPFVIRQHPFMTINGLEIDSEVRIVTSSGTLVKFYNTTSGSLNWDGKDMNGQYVPSGIYIVSARSGINNTTSVKKVFVKNNIHGG
jgi:ligand-binding sensor domain-containing protein